MPIRILIADDHTLFRRGLASLLAEVPDFVIAGEAPDGPTAIHIVPEVQPDIVLMDIHMPGGNGVQAVRDLSRVHPGLPVIMLTVSEKDDDLLEAIQAGAQGYFLKNAGTAELVSGIRRVVEGHPVLDPALTGAVFRQLTRPVEEPPSPDAVPPLSPLSLREAEILTLIAAGHTNREVARLLHLSENTVKTHLRRIMGKLGVNTRSEAVSVTKAKGWVSAG